MKKAFLLLFLVCLYALGKTQTIQRGEYFVDTDPGVGNATLFTFTGVAGDSSWVNSLAVPLGTLSDGPHNLYFRTIISDGRWSHTARVIFRIVSPISNGEYFFDIDPGLGNGTSFNVSPGDSVSLTNFPVPIGGLTIGFHSLYFRTRTTSGAWGIASKSPTDIFVKPAVQAGEYYFDTDPGAGNGTAFNVTASDSVSLTNFSVPVGALTTGLHSLYFRTRSTSGAWGIASKSPTDIFVKPAVQAGEYYFDTDPGAGNGTAFTVTASDSVTVTSLPMLVSSTLSPGAHDVYYRTKGSNGTWGISEKLLNRIYVIPKIVSGEYYFDTDPGVGNGTSFNVIPSDSISITNLPITANASLVPGFHDVYLRTKGSDGAWSVAQKVRERIFVLGKVISGEYYFDADPGVGNGTAFSVIPSDSVSLTNLPLTVSNSIVPGFHDLYLRTKGSNGAWSIVEKVPQRIYVIGKVIAGEYFFDTDPGIGNGTGFSVIPSDSVSLANLPLSVSNSIVPGFHDLYLRTKGSNGAWSIPEKVAQRIYVTSQIVAGEYYFDTDPGFGNATPYNITLPSDSISQTFAVAVPGNIPIGPHVLYTRTKNNAGTWSNIEAQRIYVVSPIIKAEYFVDIDPGLGNGIAINFASPSDSVSANNISVSVNSLNLGTSWGLHKLFVRTQNVQQEWSTAEHTVFRYCSALPMLTYELPGPGPMGTPVRLLKNSEVNSYSFRDITSNGAPFSDSLLLQPNGLSRTYELLNTQGGCVAFTDVLSPPSPVAIATTSNNAVANTINFKAWRYPVYFTDSSNKAIGTLTDKGQNLGNVTLQYYQNTGPIRYTGSKSYLDRNWLLQYATVPDTLPNFQLFFTNAELSAYQAAEPSVVSVNNLGGSRYFGPNQDEQIGNNTPNSYVAPNNLSFGSLGSYNGYAGTIISGAIPGEYYFNKEFTLLPISFVQFEARSSQCKTSLWWEIAPALDALYFEVQSAPMGSNDYRTVAKVMAATNQTRYEIVLPEQGGDRIYRIKGVDLTSQAKYSLLRIVKNACDKLSIQVVNNLIVRGGIANLEVSCVQPTLLDVAVFSADGKLVLQKVIPAATGTTSHLIDIGNMGKGIYLIYVTKNGQSVFSSKLIVN